MSPYLPLIGLIALLAVGAGGFKYGGHVREAEIRAQEAKEDEVRAKTFADAMTGAATAIAQQKVKQVTIRQETEREIVDKPVYRDCVVDPRVLELTNAALTGVEPRSVVSSELPKANADAGQQPR